VKSISILLAAGALITGLKAAYHWHASSLVEIYPGWTSERPEPVDRELRQIAQYGATLTAVAQSAAQNKVAAIWTAASVILGGASSILGALAA